MTNALTEKTHLVTDSFDGMDDLLSYLDRHPKKWGCADNGSDYVGKPEFFGTNTYEEAENLAKYGWPDGLKEMSEAVSDMAKLVNPYMSPDNYLDVAGAYPNVPAACAGEISNMVNFQNGALKQKPVIKLLVNCGAPAFIEGSWIMNRGAALLSYVDTLENSGYPMEIELYNLAYAGNIAHFLRNTVKLPGQLLNMDRLAFCLANPAYLRRMKFRLIESHTEFNFASVWRGASYGSPRSLDKEALESLNLGLCIHFPKIEESGYSNKQTALESVRDEIISQITAQGYEVPNAILEGQN